MIIVQKICFKNISGSIVIGEIVLCIISVMELTVIILIIFLDRLSTAFSQQMVLYVLVIIGI